MAERESTLNLVEKFASKPGVENASLDFKSKEIVESTERRKKLVKVASAMANQEGGTLIIGIRTEGDDLRIQHFDTESEVRQHLSQTAISNTNPGINKHWEMEFISCLGNHILRIDVNEAEDKLVEFNNDGTYELWIRIEDGMRPMEKSEIAEFYERRVSDETKEGARQEKNSMTTPQKEKQHSLTELFRRSAASTKRDNLLIIGWYLEKVKGKTRFNRAEIKEQSQISKVPLGKNLPRDIKNEIENAHLKQFGEKEGKAAYQLTLSGEDYVKNELEVPE